LNSTQKPKLSQLLFLLNQKEILKWISQHLEHNDVLAISSPTGDGKSFIAKTLQKSLGASYIVPSNMLMDQLVRDYPKDNAVKGITHYTCKNLKDTPCAEVKEFSEGKTCPDCPYEVARNRALAGEATVFNPLSLYYMKPDWVRPDLTIIDECHTLPGLLRGLGTKSMPKSEWRWTEDDAKDIMSVVEFLVKRKKLIHARLKEIKIPDKALLHEFNSLMMLVDLIRKQPDNYHVYKTSTPKTDVLNVAPFKVPTHLVRKIAGKGKLILMTGTMLQSDIDELVTCAPDKFAFYNGKAHIPVTSRPIQWLPVAFKMNFETPPSLVAKAVERVLEMHVGQNALVHGSYADIRKWAPFFRGKILVKDMAGKENVVQQFLAHGGTLLGGGCAEGLDLKDDLCRVIIIPKLVYQNRADEMVKRRLEAPDGDTWYAAETLKTTVQQAARGSRHVGDYCVTYILDPNFQRILQNLVRKSAGMTVPLVPTYFLEAIIWNYSDFKFHYRKVPNG